MTVRVFGEVDGVVVHEVTLRSPDGAEAKIITWGATVRDLLVPHRGGLQRVILGLETLEDHVAHSPHMGAVAGRYANRLRDGRFTLDGRVFEVPRNLAGRHAVHGGGKGFGKRPWRLAWAEEDACALTLFSPDGDAGFPGDMTVTCVYRLLAPAMLRIELSATCSAATVVNLCSHCYFNLDGSETIADHRLKLEASFMTPVDEETIPTGEVRAVAGTPFDFRTERAIRSGTDDGFRCDHNFVIAGEAGTLRPAAVLSSPLNGLRMDVRSTEPGLQVYDGAKLAVPVRGLHGRAYGAFSGLCLEPQHFPDSPNRPHFPSTRLDPGEVRRQITEYAFSDRGD